MKNKTNILNSIPVKDKQILFRREDDKTILLDNRTGQPFILNETGASIWGKINGKDDVTKIINKLKEEFEGSNKIIQDDIINLIKKLSKNNIIYLK
jgi:hypothetical protein